MSQSEQKPETTSYRLVMPLSKMYMLKKIALKLSNKKKRKVTIKELIMSQVDKLTKKK